MQGLIPDSGDEGCGPRSSRTPVQEVCHFGILPFKPRARSMDLKCGTWTLTHTNYITYTRERTAEQTQAESKKHENPCPEALSNLRWCLQYRSRTYFGPNGSFQQSGALIKYTMIFTIGTPTKGPLQISETPIWSPRIEGTPSGLLLRNLN